MYYRVPLYKIEDDGGFKQTYLGRAVIKVTTLGILESATNTPLLIDEDLRNLHFWKDILKEKGYILYIKVADLDKSKKISEKENELYKKNWDSTLLCSFLSNRDKKESKGRFRKG